MTLGDANRKEESLGRLLRQMLHSDETPISRPSDEVVYRYLSGLATPEESEQVEECLDSSSRFREEILSIIHALEDEGADHPEFDRPHPQLLDRLVSATWFRPAMAAVFLLGVSLGLYRFIAVTNPFSVAVDRWAIAIQEVDLSLLVQTGGVRSTLPTENKHMTPGQAAVEAFSALVIVDSIGQLHPIRQEEPDETRPESTRGLISIPSGLQDSLQQLIKSTSVSTESAGVDLWALSLGSGQVVRSTIPSLDRDIRRPFEPGIDYVVAAVWESGGYYHALPLKGL